MAVRARSLPSAWSFGALPIAAVCLLLASAFIAAGCSSAPEKVKHELCGNGIDDDGDGKTDCADPDCFSEPICQHVFEDCQNGVDDNGDGLVDCADPDCAGNPVCVKLENCTNGIDDNGDGLIDCADPQCQAIGAKTCGDGGSETGHCDDQIDNDNNGKIDCLDVAACQGQSCGAGCICTDGGTGSESDCGDGLDNDNNGKTDCADPDCAEQACGAGCACRNGGKVEVDCGDKRDDDGDGPIDCADSDCANQSCGTGCLCVGGAGTETVCDDAMDNDGDGNADCADVDCNNKSCGTGCVCAAGKKNETLCTDGMDNDGDGNTDCADSDCAGQSCGTGCSCANGGKAETLCNDGIDNDGDGKTDCADTVDCQGAPTCMFPAGPEAGFCNDGIDNDDDGLIDCADPDCNGGSCGAGCTCNAGAKHETACGDGIDNDGDGLKDCADPDCANTGVEICNNGVDDNCNHEVDCADPTCASDPSCTNLADGKACTANAQCTGGTCRSEASTGWPSGACVSGNGTCTYDSNNDVSSGCSGNSHCVGDEYGSFCRQACASAANCRQGYGCFSDEAADNTHNWCVPLCDTDNDCAVMGANYGCNPWSKLCESKDKGLSKLGAACSNNSQCETDRCYKTSGNGGYCNGQCRTSTGSCGGDGKCISFSGDSTGMCWDGCASATDCRSSPYTCKTPPGGTGGTVCYCGIPGDTCSSNSDCCSNICLGVAPLKFCVAL